MSEQILKGVTVGGHLTGDFVGKLTSLVGQYIEQGINTLTNDDTPQIPKALYLLGYWSGVIPGVVVGFLVGLCCYILDTVLGTLSKAYLDFRNLLKSAFVLRQNYQQLGSEEHNNYPYRAFLIGKSIITSTQSNLNDATDDNADNKFLKKAFHKIKSGIGNISGVVAVVLGVALLPVDAILKTLAKSYSPISSLISNRIALFYARHKLNVYLGTFDSASGNANAKHYLYSRDFQNQTMTYKNELFAKVSQEDAFLTKHSTTSKPIDYVTKWLQLGGHFFGRLGALLISFPFKFIDGGINTWTLNDNRFVSHKVYGFIYYWFYLVGALLGGLFGALSYLPHVVAKGLTMGYLRFRSFLAKNILEIHRYGNTDVSEYLGPWIFVTISLVVIALLLLLIPLAFTALNIVLLLAFPTIVMSFYWVGLAWLITGAVSIGVATLSLNIFLTDTLLKTAAQAYQRFSKIISDFVAFLFAESKLNQNVGIIGINNTEDDDDRIHPKDFRSKVTTYLRLLEQIPGYSAPIVSEEEAPTEQAQGEGPNRSPVSTDPRIMALITCPISNNVMEHPVKIPCGSVEDHTADKASLITWVPQHGTCPCCLAPVDGDPNTYQVNSGISQLIRTLNQQANENNAGSQSSQNGPSPTSGPTGNP